MTDFRNMYKGALYEDEELFFERAWATLPIQWAHTGSDGNFGPPPHPLDIHVNLNDDVTAKVNLRDMFAYVLSSYMAGDELRLEDGVGPSLLKFSAELRALANEVDAAVNQPVAHGAKENV